MTGTFLRQRSQVNRMKDNASGPVLDPLVRRAGTAIAVTAMTGQDPVQVERGG